MKDKTVPPPLKKKNCWRKFVALEAALRKITSDSHTLKSATTTSDVRRRRMSRETSSRSSAAAPSSFFIFYRLLLVIVCSEPRSSVLALPVVF